MKRFWVAGWCLAGVGAMVSLGCSVGRTTAYVASAGKMVMLSRDLGPTLTQSTGDHLHTINASIDQDARAFMDDLDLWYQTDRPTRLTRWVER